MEHNKYEALGDYDYQMIEAYIDKPKVTQWYVNAFKRFNINGVNLMIWNWSWWAFFGSAFFLLYRKAYGAASILVVLLTITWFVPFGWFILWILSGGYSTYFVYKSYRQKQLDVEEQIEDETQRIETMNELGGANDWAIIIGVVVQFIFFGAGIFAVGFLMTFFTFVAVLLGNAS